MRTVTVRGVEFGAGTPKICVPLVGRDAADLCAQAADPALRSADLVEWRMDWFDAILDADAARDMAERLRAALPDLPLLFTFRTRREGGERNADAARYLALCREMASSGCCDLLDIELFTGDGPVADLVALAHAHGVAAVVSSHDFTRTPALDEMTARLRRAEALGADLPKLAVMPRSPADVLALLEATARHRAAGTRPPITMAMGALGGVTRLCGEAFGSCVTFGSAAAASAPGQIPAALLRQILGALSLS